MAAACAWKKTLLPLAFVLCGVWSENNQETSPTVSKAELGFEDIAVIVLSQDQHYHDKRARLFRQHFEDQVLEITNMNGSQPLLIFTHEQWPEMQGAWTVFPIITELSKHYEDKRWIFLCEEETRINLRWLLHVLQQHDEAEEPFLGRALRDQQSTIIHHFAFFEDPSAFAYPDFTAGMALSLPLIKRIASHFLREGDNQKMLFSIDPKHELAKYILDNLGERLTAVCEFCGTASSKSRHCLCAAWQPTTFPTDCGPILRPDNLFVAVKTCSKFHQDRVPVVKRTWGNEAALIEYYSDREDPDIPTIDLGVPNTETEQGFSSLCLLTWKKKEVLGVGPEKYDQTFMNAKQKCLKGDKGHCGKTMAILQHIGRNKKLASVSWILIADDDTIINLELLRRLLPCYKSEKPVSLGERYGYAVVTGYGYNYITGGGGMVFNRAAVDLLAKEFTCPSNDSPDDMLLGMFFTSRGISQTHSRYFHQARPEDYSEDFLNTQMPISFHKHWNNDPYKVYNRLTAANPNNLPSPVTHEEL